MLIQYLMIFTYCSKICNFIVNLQKDSQREIITIYRNLQKHLLTCQWITNLNMILVESEGISGSTLIKHSHSLLWIGQSDS